MIPERGPETNRDKPLLHALSGARVNPVPVWLMRQAGRYLPEYRALREEAGGFLDMAYVPERAVEVTLQPIRRFGMDGAILFSDILTIPDALGRALSFAPGIGPQLPPIRDAAEVDALQGDMDALHARLAPVYEAVRRLAGALPGETALIGFAGAPWTVACYMIEGGASKDYAAVKRFAFAESAAFARLMDRLVAATSAYLIRQIESGAEAVQIFDSHAGQLAEAEFHAFVTAPTAEIVRRIKSACPGTPVIGFPLGAGLHLPRYAEETGMDALGLDTAVPLGWAHEALPKSLPLQGNLDPIRLLAGGAGMADEARRIIHALRDRPHIFNLGHGVQKTTPPEHVAQLLEIIRG